MQADVSSVAASGFVASLSLLALLLAVKYVLTPTLMDMFRQDVFALRRELFLFMAGGRVAPTHPAYVHLRETMNGVLLYGERVGILHALLTAWLCRGDIEEHVDRFQHAVEQIEDPATREQMAAFRNRLNGVVGKWLLFGSPTGWICLVALIALVIVSGIVALFAPQRRGGLASADEQHRAEPDVRETRSGTAIRAGVKTKMRVPASGIEARAFGCRYGNDMAAA